MGDFVKAMKLTRQTKTFIDIKTTNKQKKY